MIKDIPIRVNCEYIMRDKRRSVRSPSKLKYTPPPHKNRPDFLTGSGISTRMTMASSKNGIPVKNGEISCLFNSPKIAKHVSPRVSTDCACYFYSESGHWRTTKGLVFG